MKTFTGSLVFLFLAVAATVCAQNTSERDRIVAIAYDAINSKDAVPLMPHLADDFSIAGQSGDIAKFILQQLFAQLGVTITDIEKLSEESTADGTILIYKAVFGEMGERTSTFVFNPENKLQVLELLEMQVKTMEGESIVTKSEQPIITVPFTRAGKLIVVEALLNGEPRRFIVDSGAPKLILNSAHTLPNSIQENDSRRRISATDSQGVGGSISGMDIQAIESFDFNGIRMDDQEVITVDLAHLEDALETTIHGLIGYEVFAEYDVLYDYGRSELILLDPAATEAYLSQRYPKARMTEVAIEMNEHIPTVEVEANGSKFVLGFDSGAESGLLDGSHLASIKSAVHSLQSDTLLGANKNASLVQTGVVSELQIGGKSFADWDVSFSDVSHLNEGYGIALDGLFGYGIASRQPTLVSYLGKRIVFIEE